MSDRSPAYDDDTPVTTRHIPRYELRVNSEGLYYAVDNYHSEDGTFAAIVRDAAGEVMFYTGPDPRGWVDEQNRW